MYGKWLRLIGMCVALASACALADWNLGDGSVMTPQLPTGTYDVMVDGSSPKPQLLADDWVASVSGLVTDAHIWYSWNGDDINDPLRGISNVSLRIHENVSDGAFYRPGDVLWSGDFLPEGSSVPGRREFTTREWNDNTSTWWDPWGTSGGSHTGIYQINVDDLWGYVVGNDDYGYFPQIDGTSYWLSVVVDLAGDATPELGWHTSAEGVENVVGAGAVYNAAYTPSNVDTSIPPIWQQLMIGNAPVDMAFVMTPEPSALGLLLVGGAWLSASRRRRSGSTA